MIHILSETNLVEQALAADGVKNAAVVAHAIELSVVGTPGDMAFHWAIVLADCATPIPEHGAFRDVYDDWRHNLFAIRQMLNA